MGLDFPATGEALWALADAGGPRPEYILPVLYNESGFNPAATNGAGAPYSGISQNDNGYITQMTGVTLATYLTWPASQQIVKVTTPYFLSKVQVYGPLNSGVKTYQAEYLPATLATAKRLGSVIASSSNDPNGYYASNTVLDANHDGKITLQDLADVLTKQANTSAVRSAIKSTYALRPFAIERNPVYGTDFSLRLTTGSVVVAAALAGAVVYGWEHRAGIETALYGARAGIRRCVYG